MPEELSSGSVAEDVGGGAASEEDQGTEDQGSSDGGQGTEGDSDDEPQVPTRGSNFVKDRIIDRKNKRIEKLESGQDGDDFAQRFAQEANKLLRPALETISKLTDDQELNGFLAKPENGHFKQYEKSARRYMATYKNVPLDFIFKGLDYDNAMKRGAAAGAQAKDEGTRNSFGGSNARKQTGAPIDAWDMSEAEFEAEFNRRMNR